MYWGMGQRIMMATRFVKQHPQLFGTFITNFSCGPDAFIIGYFRDIMGRKPSLTLELDSHTADAGLETRIEAFLDIVSAYRQLGILPPPELPFNPARTFLDDGIAKVTTSSGEVLPMTDPRVTLLIASMGKIATELMGALFRGRDITVFAHPPSDEKVLKLGRANTSCKECLPLLLTTGTLLNYIYNRKRDDEVLVYFMPTAAGPCRFGQYYIFMEDLMKKREMKDVAMLSLTSENSYAGLGGEFQLKVWWGIVVSDVMEDIRSMLLANATDTEAAIDIFNEELRLIIDKFENKNLDFLLLEEQLARTAERFSRIPLRRPSEAVPTVSLIGEIFVRRDELSRQYLTEKLAEKGFAVTCSPIAEWILYSDYLLENRLAEHIMSYKEKLEFILKKRSMARYKKRIKSILSRAKLVHAEPLNINTIVDNATPYISPNLTGEAILTVGSSLTEVASHACGVIAIGPFGCMPNRLSESILTEVMTRESKFAVDPKNDQLRTILADIEDLPFLAIESDGSPFPQLITAKLETFCLRAERLHNAMQKYQN
jgi:predicted nucleotide-binding protein (sugar kinase/HSP70/actin superfamily)